MEVARRWGASTPHQHVHLDPVVPLRHSSPAPIHESSLQAKLRSYRRTVEQRSAEQQVGIAYAQEPRLPPRPKGAPRPTPVAALRRLRLRGGSGRTTPSDGSSQDSAPQSHQQRRRAPWVPTGVARPAQPRQSSAWAQPPLPAVAAAHAEEEKAAHQPPPELEVPEPSLLLQQKSSEPEEPEEPAQPQPSEGATSQALESWSAAVWARFGANGTNPAPQVVRSCAKWIALSCNTRRGVFSEREDLEEACVELGLPEDEAASVAARLWAGLACAQAEGGREGRTGLPSAPLLRAVEEICPELAPGEQRVRSQVEQLPALDGYWPDPEGGYVPWGERTLTISSVGAHMESTATIRSLEDLELPERAASPPLPEIEVFAECRRRRPPPRLEERRLAEAYARARVADCAREVERREAAAALAAAELAAAVAAEEARRIAEERALAAQQAREAAAAEVSETAAAEMVAAVVARHEASEHAKRWLGPLYQGVVEVVEVRREQAKRPRKARLSTTISSVVKFKALKAKTEAWEAEEEAEDETLAGLCHQGHPLTWRPPRIGDCWTCAGRLEPGGCASGYTEDEPLSGWLRRFGCNTCDIDLCLKCYARTLRWQGLQPPDEDSQCTLDRAVHVASRGSDRVEELLGRHAGSIRNSRGSRPSRPGSKTSNVSLWDSGFASESNSSRPASDMDRLASSSTCMQQPSAITSADLEPTSSRGSRRHSGSLRAWELPLRPPTPPRSQSQVGQPRLSARLPFMSRRSSEALDRQVAAGRRLERNSTQNSSRSHMSVGTVGLALSHFGRRLSQHFRRTSRSSMTSPR